ncbi:hypothetical protein HDV04_005871 [Boothiomyces sp. JEL0838]|nr:hypothetical protein HDV04_005871 [Boothiomyces sp. JEL0838]
MNRHILTLLFSSVVLADCSALYGQCGGQNWNGPTCCQAGSVCKYSSDWYSQCLPDPALQNSGCSAMYAQCGGQNWNGPTCCQTGSSCQVSNAWYSQCLPSQQSAPPPPKPNPPPPPKPNPPPAPKPNPPPQPVIPSPPKPVVTPAPVNPNPNPNPNPQPVTPQPIIKIPAPAPSPATNGKNQNGDNSGSGSTNSPSQSTGNSGNTGSNSNGNSNSGNSTPGASGQGSSNGIAVNPVESSSTILPPISVPTNMPAPSDSGSSGSSVNVPLVTGLTLGIVVAGVVVAMYVSYKDRMVISDDDSILGYYNDLPPKAKPLPLVESSPNMILTSSLYSHSNQRITTVPSIPETLIAMPNQNRSLRDSTISIPHSDEIETPIMKHNEIQPVRPSSMQFNFPAPPEDPTLNRVETFVKNAQVNFPKSLYCKTKSADALRNGKPQLLSSFQLVPIPNEKK